MRPFPCAGLVEAWAEGVGWQAVTDDCNLDGGDIARLLSRTTDLLRQVMAAVDWLQGPLPSVSGASACLELLCC